MLKINKSVQSTRSAIILHDIANIYHDNIVNPGYDLLHPHTQDRQTKSAAFSGYGMTYNQTMKKHETELKKLTYPSEVMPIT